MHAFAATGWTEVLLLFALFAGVLVFFATLPPIKGPERTIVALDGAVWTVAAGGIRAPGDRDQSYSAGGGGDGGAGMGGGGCGGDGGGGC